MLFFCSVLQISLFINLFSFCFSSHLHLDKSLLGTSYRFQCSLKISFQMYESLLSHMIEKSKVFFFCCSYLSLWFSAYSFHFHIFFYFFFFADIIQLSQHVFFSFPILLYIYIYFILSLVLFHFYSPFSFPNWFYHIRF